MPISPTTDAGGWKAARRTPLPKRRDGKGGFTLIEVMLALTVLAMLAALGLPFVRPQAGSAALRAKAFDIAVLLRTERNKALRSGTATEVRVDEASATISADRSPAVITMPKAITIRLSAERAPGFRFYPDGSASGGQLALLSGRQSTVVDVSGATAAISILGDVR